MDRSVLFNRGMDDVFGATAIVGLRPHIVLRFIDRAQFGARPVGLF